MQLLIREHTVWTLPSRDLLKYYTRGLFTLILFQRNADDIITMKIMHLPEFTSALPRCGTTLRHFLGVAQHFGTS